MEKIKFTLQIAVLILAFPVWFLTEIKRTDKVLQENFRDTTRTINRTPVVKHTEYEPASSELVMLPFAGQMIENN